LTCIVDSGAQSVTTAAVTVAAGFDPVSLFSGGEQGGFYDASDLSALWQDIDGTVPITADGQSVARIDDKSGRGNHLIQSDSAKRPLYKTAGGLHWLQFDGSDDLISATRTFAMASGAGFLVGVAQRELVRKNSSTYAFSVFGAPNFQAHIPFGSSGTSFDAGGNTGAQRITGTSLAVGVDLVAIQQRTAANAYSVRRNGAAFGTATTNTATIEGGFHRLGTHIDGGNHFNGRIYAFIFVQADKSANVSDVEAWLADKSGVTL
jgi:hypothetical protein